jgi:hypothetical protein
LDGLIRDQEGRSWIIDHKTCKAFPDFRISDMDVQFLGYTWAAQRMSNAGMLQRFGVPKGAQIHGVLYNGLRKQKPGPRVTAPLFMRQYIQHSKQELMYFDSWLQDIYAEMQSPKVYPHPSWKCGTCPFYTPCLARQRGDDEEYLLRTLYRVKESRGQVYDPDS